MLSNFDPQETLIIFAILKKTYNEITMLPKSKLENRMMISYSLKK
jgi:hypothetical protein